MAVDKRSVYWMNGDGSFFGMLKSGGSIESPPVTVPTLTEGTPRCGLASDGARLYATRDGTAAGLWTVPLATEGTTVFASTAGSAIALEVSPSSVAVDERFIYLTFYDDGSVRKIPKGGGAAIVLASGGVRSHAIALGDEEAYWLDLVDQEGARVMRASKDGGPSTELARTAGDPRGWSTFGRGEMLLVAGGRAFWPEPDRHRLMALEITGVERAPAPYPIAVSLPASGPLGTDGARLFVPLASGDRTELGAIHVDDGGHETKQLGHGTITAMTFDRTTVYWIDAAHSLWSMSL